MAQLFFENTKISGISACVPSNIENNYDYDWISVQERELLVKTTGVEERRVAPPGVTASDLCFSAAEKLLNELGWKKETVDALIFVSQSGDYILPATAVILQDRLGLSKNCMSFDVGLGCSGYVYGLSIAAALINSGSIKRVLLLAGDKSSLSASYKDKSIYPLFGDAGTATALEWVSGAAHMFFNLQNDGSGYKNIIITDGLGRNPANENSLKLNFITKGIERRPLDLALNGTEIFDFSLREVIPNIKQALTAGNMTIGEIDYFIFHQANLLMNETLRRMMKIPSEKVPYSIQKFGNTSSASIPLTIITQLQTIKDKPCWLLLCGFGVGLSWGTAIVRTDNLICPGIIEYNE